MLSSYPNFSRGEINFLVENEDVVHLDDLIYRRTMIGKMGELTEAGLMELAEVSADALGWDKSKKLNEIDRVMHIMVSKHRMRFNEFIEINNVTRN
jgi:glycerol-3-phosphate dehydrogenase